MCAIEAGRRGRRVAVLERAERQGKKILISADAVTHQSPLLAGKLYFSKSSFAKSWPLSPADFISLVEASHSVSRKDRGQLFCDAPQDVLGMLERNVRTQQFICSK